MPKLTDNELDKLFRDAADRTSPEFDPQDWDDMAKRLELEERAAKARSTTLYSMVALLLLYSLLPQWGAKTEIQSASMFQSQTTEDLTDMKGVENKVDVEQNTSAHENTQGQVENENATQVIDAEPATAIQKDNINKVDPGKTVKATSVTKYNGQTVQPSHVNGSGDVKHSIITDASNQEKISYERSAIVGSSMQQANSLGSQPDVSPDNGLAEYGFPVTQHVDAVSAFSEVPHGTGVRLAADSTIVDAAQIIKPVALDSLGFNAETIIKEKQPVLAHNWFVKVAASPDFSSIDYTKPGDPGINIGLLGEYQLSNHFSISTGAIWSKKLYDLDNPDKSYGSGGYTSKAKTLNGDCRVLDIPINLTYYVFPQRRTNLFVTLGTSSYIMLKEQYIYTVWTNHKEYQYEENYSHENNEWFSMLNISLGIQYRLTKHFLIQGEPFLKAPMSGVGAGKVNLMSTGVFFSLKYQISNH